MLDQDTSSIRTTWPLGAHDVVKDNDGDRDSTATAETEVARKVYREHPPYRGADEAFMGQAMYAKDSEGSHYERRAAHPCHPEATEQSTVIDAGGTPVRSMVGTVGTSRDEEAAALAAALRDGQKDKAVLGGGEEP